MYVCMYDVCEGQPMLICTLYNSCTVLYGSTIYTTQLQYSTVLNTVYSKYNCTVALLYCSATVLVRCAFFLCTILIGLETFPEADVV